MEDINRINCLEKFFDCNMKVKQTLADLTISEENFYNEEYTMMYLDKLFKELVYMQDQFLIMASTMFGDSIIQVVKKKFASYNRVLLNCGTDPKKIHNFYVQCITDIPEDVINEVKETCVGYSVWNSIYGLLNKDLSINALLHVLHSSVMNNEAVYGSISKIGEIQNDFNYPVTLRGKSENKIANMIFQYFPKDLDVGYTDIVALDNKTLMMVRDRGHALTIELEEYQDGVMVRYFIPKLCNIEMINNLPGINKVPLDVKVHSGARGEFFATKENIILDIYNFINCVPMDKDMPDLFGESLKY